MASETSGILTTPPQLHKGTAEEVIGSLKAEMATTGWQQSPGAPGAGEAMVRLFGRLADLIIARINQIPENHFRAFLESAGVDLLPPQPARAEITFFPAKDAPSPLRVPAGTQVAAKRSASRPEVVFETERDLNVISSGLDCCIVVDPVRISDRTAEAAAVSAASFAVCQGDRERQRLLSVGDDGLFDFPDDPSRLNGTVFLDILLASPGRPDLDGWSLQWLYFDGTQWRDLVDDGGGVGDSTNGLSRDGRILFSNLPKMVKCAFDKESGAWLACSLTGGAARDHLPVIRLITAGREVMIPDSEPKPLEGVFSAIHAGAACIPLEPAGEFFALGQRPGRLDSLYLKSDEAFSKGGAEVSLSFDLSGVPAEAVGQELDELGVVWEYFSADGWTAIGESGRNGVVSSKSGFLDQSNGFTTTGKGRVVSFTVPGGDGTRLPAWTASKVGGMEGLWLRARVAAGGYGTDPSDPMALIAPPVFAPSIGNLKLSYGGFVSRIAARELDAVYGLVDSTRQRHSFAAGGAFAPFAGSSDFPALYLGFTAPFPPNEWIQLLLDSDEERNGDQDLPLILWEYWSLRDKQWKRLPASDESAGFRIRGYLGFNAPADFGPSVEFGKELSWMRARPHVTPPVAVAPAGVTVDPAAAGETTVTLDASGSGAFDGQRIARYCWRLLPPEALAGPDIDVATTGENEATVLLDASATAESSGRDIVGYSWRLVSSSRLVARAGNDRIVPAEGDTAHVTLDFTGSVDLGGTPIRRYLLRKVVPQAVEALPTPYLRGIRCNTVPVVNGASFSDELLGSGSGKQGATFRLARGPVTPDLQLYVRESDQLPAGERTALAREHGRAGSGFSLAEIPLTVTADQGVWVRWLRVDDFFSSNGSSRHFVLDQTTGELRFGDGVRGMIPPIGRDNVKAFRYRSHQGETGNVAAGEVTVVRNPAGQLAAVKRVVNPEGAVGGGDAETVPMVRERGPRTIKHRGRAITVEDYAWMARDAGREVAAAWCLPARDPDGKGCEGWVTVVIVPNGAGDRPYPRPPLLRLVREYLQARALANLGAERHIVVTGPAYIEASVSARIVPVLPEKGDEVKLAAVRRLREFFHPLAGGPLRSGWELGRDVFLSEIYAELEAVPGVDHVTYLAMDGSLLQFDVELLPRQRITRGAGRGSRVGSFDDRLRLVLAEPLILPEAPEAAIGSVTVSLYGFRVNEMVTLVDGSNRVLVESLGVTALPAGNDALLLRMPFTMTENLPPPDSLALVSSDGSIRIPLADWSEGEGETTVARLAAMEPGDTLCIVSGGQRYPELEFMKVLSVGRRHDRIAIPEGHLACSGTHDIEMVLGE